MRFVWLYFSNIWYKMIQVEIFKLVISKYAWLTLLIANLTIQNSLKCFKWTDTKMGQSANKQKRWLRRVTDYQYPPISFIFPKKFSKAEISCTTFFSITLRKMFQLTLNLECKLEMLFHIREYHNFSQLSFISPKLIGRVFEAPPHSWSWFK